ncbi:MAG: carboxypeptidase regulatory-like domain-containing protein [Candidatus Competibacteraceae bacterium]|nr:carboxypeptidase regulatory-like domain-containing protein [Candidatus Competibacteraceae bacterium]
MITIKANKVFGCLLGAVLAMPLVAQESLQVSDYQGIAYVSGGVGVEEREALAAMSDRFNLKLTFAMSAGNYLSDVQVRIVDRSGNPVFEATADGPLLYALLPPGSYTVQVNGFEQDFQRQTQIQANKQNSVSLLFGSNS